MRKVLILFAVISATVFAQQPMLQPPVVDNGPEYLNKTFELDPNVTQTITLGPGIITTLKFDPRKPIEKIISGSAVAAIEYDEELNRLTLLPLGYGGKTNMIVTIDGTDYVFIVRVTKNLKEVIHTRSYVVNTIAAENLMADLRRQANAPALMPQQIDTVAFVKAIERARTDRFYRDSLQDLRTIHIGKVAQWNDCMVHFLEVNTFLDTDLLIFKVQLVNTTGFGLYCNARQLGLRVGHKDVNIKASFQNSPDSIVLPGQMETIWLFVQGEKISAAGNDWTLLMPPDKYQVRQILGSK